ncbi:protein-tyrosine sulfotransferase 1-like [Dendronephthya gigantea]|uniref:protein-tyrosine sulfotransferase 1-like n=1 Tax=Dendronephthya gigantea TaxID=151771 RepID=UPI00106C94C7|nr:protein-tyrosine sulfotransferase 1-like [Dendronephthya gigantea]
MLHPRSKRASFGLYITGVLSGIWLCYIILNGKRVWYESTLKNSRSSTSRIGRDLPIVFIGGHPRSGTTLMRVLLDAHPSFHCGQETHIIPDLLTIRRKYSRGRDLKRLLEAGLSLDLINTTIADSILHIIKSHGGHSKRRCNKDPFSLKHIPYLAQMFPKAQFILMVRDARAVIHSIRENNIKISRFPKKDSEALRRWNKILEIMLQDCLRVGSERCKVVHYESLVVKPRSILRQIAHFLRAPWSESVMNHTGYLDKADGILLSRLEKSTHQVRKPIYNDSLHLWMTSPLNIRSEKLVSMAPMMDTLGYLRIGNPPKYTELKLRYPSKDTYE